MGKFALKIYFFVKIQDVLKFMIISYAWVNFKNLR